jgi:hypothetical protein
LGIANDSRPNQEYLPWFVWAGSLP